MSDFFNIAFLIVMVAGLGFAIRFGAKHKIGEARFDSETGKQIHDE